ncbi:MULTISPECIES: DNA-binding protein WhiA [Megamonas]|uniref:DNA-binding protein WhiA n=1 Tax=Megamonas TaxID=158846 RepID=UPI000E41E631|nr:MULTISPECIES: DNA-binding protein WhiA [Megamonas]RGO02825.1 DNA-binding protein WhiA [Megamonas rupellensis]
MPSFASQVKNELVHVLGSQVCCKTAELAALLRMGATISFNSKHDFGINFVTENAAVARKILTLLKASVPQGIHTEVTVRRSRRLRKHNNYAVRATPSPEASSILKKLGFLTAKNLLDAGTDRNILQNDCCKIAYLRGAFLGGGSVNKPEGEYHLEFVTDNYTFAKLIRDLCYELYLPVGLTDRKNVYIVYLKESEAILELLALIGVEESLLQAFESARNLKEIRNQVNRLVNCETANLQRTINAAMKQIENINLLIKYDEYDELPKVLKQTANLRLNNPEASLTELAELLNCSRSAINHRMRKIDALAMQIRKDNSIKE